MVQKDPQSPREAIPDLELPVPPRKSSPEQLREMATQLLQRHGGWRTSAPRRVRRHALNPETVGSCIPDLSPHPIKPKTVKHRIGSGTTHPPESINTHPSTAQVYKTMHRLAQIFPRVERLIGGALDLYIKHYGTKVQRNEQAGQLQVMRQADAFGRQGDGHEAMPLMPRRVRDDQ